MELHNQIKKYRTGMKLSQEELGEKIYVTRQTISNWENNKNYPDVHSLLLLSSFFNISLDQLIKGDLEMMKEEINKAELEKFNRDGVIFFILMVLLMVSAVPLMVFLDHVGVIIFGILFTITMYFAMKIEKFKKNNDIQTFKEILSFSEGKRLDEIQKAQEYDKRSYQKILSALAAAGIAFVVAMLFIYLFKNFIF